MVVELLYYISALKELSSGVAKKFYVVKDTTCSMAQHGGKILGYNELSMKMLNLNNLEIGYDTYQVLINRLKDSLADKNPAIWLDGVLALLTRSFLKNLIMTCEYGVTILTARREFLQIVNALIKTQPEYSIFLKEIYLNDLYSVLREGGPAQLFYRDSKSSWITLALAHSGARLQLPDITIPLTYYHRVTHTLYYDHTAPGQKRSRTTITVHFNIGRNQDLYQKILAQKRFKNYKYLDNRKARAAAYVNAVHALDAVYLREIAYSCRTNHVSLATIHDGFVIPFTHGA